MSIIISCFFFIMFSLICAYSTNFFMWNYFYFSWYRGYFFSSLAARSRFLLSAYNSSVLFCFLWLIYSSRFFICWRLDYCSAYCFYFVNFICCSFSNYIFFLKSSNSIYLFFCSVSDKSFHFFTSLCISSLLFTFIILRSSSS